MPARWPDKARATLAGISNVEHAALHLLDPASIAAFAHRFLATGCALDLLINNAGIIAVPLMRNTRGDETQFAATHLGHLQLTSMLWQALEMAGSARVVTLSSAAHRRAAFDFDDPNFMIAPYDK